MSTSPYRYVKRKNHPLSTPSGRIPEHRLILWEKIGPGPHPCHWCGSLVDWLPGSHTRAGALTVDHVDEDQSNNDPGNLVPSCHTCNVRRARDKRFVDTFFVVNKNGIREIAELRECLTCGENFLIAKKHMRRKDRNQGRYCSMQCVYDRNR